MLSQSDKIAIILMLIVAIGIAGLILCGNERFNDSLNMALGALGL